MYTDVSIVSCPEQASAGQTVPVTIMTTSSVAASIRTYAIAHGMSTGAWILIMDTRYDFSIGEQKDYYGTFLMPSENVSVEAYSYYYDALDDSDTKAVALISGGFDMNAMMGMMMMVMVMGMMIPMMR